MAEQQTGIALAESLSCTLDTTKEHPERYATILGSEKPLPLSKIQALALFKLMLGHLGQIAGDELRTDGLLEQVNLVEAFHSSLEWLTEWSQKQLEDPNLLKEALEQYHFTFRLLKEMQEVLIG